MATVSAKDRILAFAAEQMRDFRAFKKQLGICVERSCYEETHGFLRCEECRAKASEAVMRIKKRQAS